MYLASVSSRLLLNDTNSWDLKKCYGCYDGILRDVSWSDDSKYILQVNSKGVVEILSASDHDIRSLQHIPVKDSWSAAFHRDGHRNVALGTKNGSVIIWDTKNKSITKSFPPPTQQSHVNFVSYNAKNTSLAATLQNGDTVIYGLVSNIPVLTIKLPYSKSISSMKFHHEARSIIGLATDEGHVLLRDVATNKDKVYFENIHGSPVSDIAFSLINRDVMLSSGFDKVMNVYDVRVQIVVSSIKTPYTLTSLAINLENQVALGTKNGLVLVYDLRDLTHPFKVLKGHEEEVHRVSFQPLRKRLNSADISLREDVENNISPGKMSSPLKSRTSDLFFVSETPPKVSLDPPTPGDIKEDSFLVMMGLDKSINDLDDASKISEFERRSEGHEARYRQLDAEKNISKVSTPYTNKPAENLGFPSPLLSNGVGDDGRCSSNLPQETNSNHINAPNINTQTVEELKDFIKLSLSVVDDNNRKNFLFIMMELTKSKLHFEKELSNINQKIDGVIQNQSAMVETIRKLTLDIDQLKRHTQLN